MLIFSTLLVRETAYGIIKLITPEIPQNRYHLPRLFPSSHSLTFQINFAQIYQRRIVKLSATPLRNRPHMVFCSQGTS